MHFLTTAATALGALALVQASPLDSRNNDGGKGDYGSYGNPGYKGRVGPSGVNCKRQYYDISVTSQNTLFENVMSNANEVSKRHWRTFIVANMCATSQTVLTSLLSKFVAQLPATMGNFTEQFTDANKKAVSGTYKIAGTYCEPESGYKDNGSIQLLVHGYVCTRLSVQKQVEQS